MNRARSVLPPSTPGRAHPVTLPAPIRVELFPGVWRSLRGTEKTEEPRFLWVQTVSGLFDLLDWYGMSIRDPHFERRWVGRAVLTRLSLSALERGERKELPCGYVRCFRLTTPGVEHRSPLGRARLAFGTEDDLDWGDGFYPNGNRPLSDSD